MSLPGHDPTCMVIHATHTHYTCMNCQQAQAARKDERQRILLALTDQMRQTKPRRLVAFGRSCLEAWDDGYHNGLVEAHRRIKDGEHVKISRKNTADAGS